MFVGHSGCNKIITLRLIAELEQPDSGSIYIDDNLPILSAATIHPRPGETGLFLPDQDWSVVVYNGGI